MKSGFYSVQSSAGGDSVDDFAVVILAHLKDGRFTGVDLGGCRVTGTYREGPGGRTEVQLAYSVKAGALLPDGSVLDRPKTVERDVILEPATAEGAPQEVDIGFGPMLIRLEWLAEPA